MCEDALKTSGHQAELALRELGALVRGPSLSPKHQQWGGGWPCFGS